MQNRINTLLVLTGTLFFLNIDCATAAQQYYLVKKLVDTRNTPPKKELPQKKSVQKETHTIKDCQSFLDEVDPNYTPAFNKSGRPVATADGNPPYSTSLPAAMKIPLQVDPLKSYNSSIPSIPGLNASLGTGTLNLELDTLNNQVSFDGFDAETQKKIAKVKSCRQFLRNAWATAMKKKKASKKGSSIVSKGNSIVSNKDSIVKTVRPEASDIITYD